MPQKKTQLLSHRQSVSIKYSLYMLPVTDSLYLSHTVFVCPRQSVSITDSLFMSQTVCVCHRQSMSVTDILGLSQTVFGLSLIVCILHRQSVAVSNTLPDSSWLGSWLIYAWFPSRYAIKICHCSVLRQALWEMAYGLTRAASHRGLGTPEEWGGYVNMYVIVELTLYHFEN